MSDKQTTKREETNRFEACLLRPLSFGLCSSSSSAIADTGHLQNCAILHEDGICRQSKKGCWIIPLSPSSPFRCTRASLHIDFPFLLWVLSTMARVRNPPPPDSRSAPHRSPLSKLCSPTPILFTNTPQDCTEPHTATPPNERRPPAPCLLPSFTWAARGSSPRQTSTAS